MLLEKLIWELLKVELLFAILAPSSSDRNKSDKPFRGSSCVEAITSEEFGSGNITLPKVWFTVEML
jgi:hypothetical protein